MGLTLLDQIGTGLGVLIVSEPMSDCVHSAADTIARFNNRDACAMSFEISRRGKSSQSRSNDRHGHT